MHPWNNHLFLFIFLTVFDFVYTTLQSLCLSAYIVVPHAVLVCPFRCMFRFTNIFAHTVAFVALYR